MLPDSPHASQRSEILGSSDRNRLTPFGFTLGHDRTLIVSEAAASTFRRTNIRDHENGPTLETIRGSLADGGAAACWIVTERGRLAFAANSASNTMSSFSVSPHGDLQLLASAVFITSSNAEAAFPRRAAYCWPRRVLPC